MLPVLIYFVSLSQLPGQAQHWRQNVSFKCQDESTYPNHYSQFQFLLNFKIIMLSLTLDCNSVSTDLYQISMGMYTKMCQANFSFIHND